MKMVFKELDIYNINFYLKKYTKLARWKVKPNLASKVLGSRCSGLGMDSHYESASDHKGESIRQRQKRLVRSCHSAR